MRHLISLLVMAVVLAACAFSPNYSNLASYIVRVGNERGHGSGVLVDDASGRQIVLSAWHVLKNRDMFATNSIEAIAVTYPVPIEKLDAGYFVIGSDTIGSSAPIRCSKLNLGEEIVAIGYPLEFPMLYNWGRVSLVDYEIDDEEYFIADMSINMGQSGGPVFDANGSVVGLVVAQGVRPVVGMGGMMGVYEAAELALIVPMSSICEKLDWRSTGT